jgi:hypothetical protein
MIPRAITVDVVPPYGLRLTFEDGTSGLIDFRPLLFERDTGVFAALRDPTEFARVRVDLEADTIVWPNGADIDPYVLYERAHGSAVN